MAKSGSIPNEYFERHLEENKDGITLNLSGDTKLIFKR